LASEIFSSPDDLTYGDNERRMHPLQDLNPAAGPPYLIPTYGTPFTPGSLARERRYTWLIVARKVSASQVYGPGPDGVLGSPVAGADDVLENRGPDQLASVPPYPPVNAAADDPARDMVTDLPVPAPIGPFEVTIVAYYSRDLTAREAVYANNNAAPPSPIFFSTPPGRQVVVGFGPVYPPNVATLVKRNDGIPFPDLPIGSYIMDTTFDSATGLRNGFVYRVMSKHLEMIPSTPPVQVLAVTLDRPARANGQVLTVLKGAVGVFEKEVP
jgi:hypothetical protein